jgi:hypothetical protein
MLWAILSVSQQGSYIIYACHAELLQQESEEVTMDWTLMEETISAYVILVGYPFEKSYNWNINSIRITVMQFDEDLLIFCSRSGRQRERIL